MRGSTFLEISGKSLTKIQIRLPSFKEQSRIGHLFLQIDNLIAATQHKIEKLELAKEATLQHMFNKSWKISGNFPSWKDADLGSLNLDISDGDWIESEHIHRTGSYRIIQTGNIGLGIFVVKSETAKYIHQSDYDELHANEVFPGDILICRLAEPAGRAIILPDIHHRMVTVVDVAVIRPSSQINAYFLVSELNRPKVLHEVGTLTSGSTRKRISRKNLEKVNLEMPSIDEQNKIAIIVESFSNIISLTQSNLTNLKTVKAFLMQSLFA
ncbi:restriction endonuclease subunit S [Lacticaseibacillus rhamnosus]|uniref:restriction endonuclease subunit S n=1 Tax=Lacticaseibacillus rhamnosus TaxID=47715 RepID=UPI00288AC1C5|nr:restriction endonuclease subunit S [Lacticaseibacillus rhamnosus]